MPWIINWQGEGNDITFINDKFINQTGLTFTGQSELWGIDGVNLYEEGTIFDNVGAQFTSNM